MKIERDIIDKASNQAGQRVYKSQSSLERQSAKCGRMENWNSFYLSTSNTATTTTFSHDIHTRLYHIKP